jgi:hypothetical protein
MRLSEDKIKQAILHPALDIRRRALEYFSVCFSQDESVVPLVIEAVEKYGGKEAYWLVGGVVGVKQTEATISWIVDELNKPDAGGYENYAFNLTRVLCQADPTLLVSRKDAILASRHFCRGLQEDFTQRLELSSWDEAACWQRLEEICEEGKDDETFSEATLTLGNAIVETLARSGAELQERVLAVLAQPIDDYASNPMKWLEPLMVSLAGRARLEAAVPLIVDKLHEEDDLLSEYCTEALTRIATDAVLAAVAEGYDDADDQFRYSAMSVLESIHSDLSVQVCLNLMAKEADRDLQRGLARAALSHFASEAIEPTRKLLGSQQIRGDARELRNDLVAICTIMEHSFPELEAWRAAIEQERQENDRRLEEVAGDPLATMQLALERAREYFQSDEVSNTEKPPTPVPAKVAAEKRLPAKTVGRAGQGTGRNDPCPCGSGKKYKKCCMRS